MEYIIQTKTYPEVLNAFLSCYVEEFGSRKLEDVMQKVRSSNKIALLLLRAKRDSIRLGVDDYLLTLHSSSSFWLATGETMFLASTIMLSMWEDEVGRPNGLSSDVYLNVMFFRLMQKCDNLKTHLNGKPNFFEKFKQVLLLYFTYKPDPEISIEGFDEEPDEAGMYSVDRQENASPFTEEQLKSLLSETYSNIYDNQSTCKEKKPIVSRGLLYCSSCYVALDEANNCIRCKTHYDN